MSFDDMKAILNDFGLWEKVSPCYEPDGSIKGYDFLERFIEKCSSLLTGLTKVAFLDDMRGKIEYRK